MIMKDQTNTIFGGNFAQKEREQCVKRPILRARLAWLVLALALLL
uniref:Uncharacterized protein n=1 Tax=Arundo donax TaxID=35708 RepID=A0A0A8XVL4_ARUDO